jgi:hypothetical protein
MGLAVVIALIFMIPLSNTVFAKPVFDGTSVGITCNGLWNQITALKEKQKKGPLSQEESSALGRAESNYKDLCLRWYGPEVPRIDPELQDSSPSKPTSPQGNLNEDLATKKSSIKENLPMLPPPDLKSEDKAAEQQEPSKPTSPQGNLNDNTASQSG